ncbi:MAG TPA: PKD domain-containing protein, partial [Bacteroidetes bacterium]|nr:PKD domain-containing protein [Bacteroidota bacterium]
IRARHAAWLRETRDLRDVNNPDNQLSKIEANAIYRVPLVVHVIHDGANGNLTDAEVQAGVALLNEAFANGQNFNPSRGVDVEIEFCLAERDPMGNVSTGIVRTNDPISSTFNKDTDDGTIKNLSRWDPTRYVHIYTVANIQGSVAGYAYLPGAHGSSVDGIVVEAAYMKGFVHDIKVTVHEMGHYLGLRHTWQGGCTNNDCLMDGDGICDTPPDNSQTGSPCATPANTCQTDDDDLSANNPFRPIANGGLGDQPDLEADYMDYGDLNCYEVFTQGQKDVMIASLTNIRSSLITPQNLASTGCQCDLALPCTPIARFEADESYICPGQMVHFRDLSSGPATSWSWFFQGGSPSTSTAQNPVATYASSGAFEVTLTISNGAGNDTETITSYINVVNPGPPPIAEGFESTLPLDWVVSNEDGGGTWAVTDTTAHTGNQCLTMDNFNFPSDGSTDELSTRIVDLSAFTAADFSFDYAYQRHSFAFTYDTLSVFISSDCGTNWNMVWSKGGPILSTVTGNNFFSRFVPTSTSDWDHANLDMSAYAGASGVKIKFQNIGHSGQSVYLDNVNMSGVVGTDGPSNGLDWRMQTAPNPFRDHFQVNYTLRTKTSVRFSLYDV